MPSRAKCAKVHEVMGTHARVKISPPLTLGAALAASAAKAPKRAALVQHENGQRVSYRRLGKLVDAYAYALLAAGVTRGERVATQLPTTIEHVALMLATTKIGAVVAPLDLQLSLAELWRQLEAVTPKMFVFATSTPARDLAGTERAVRETWRTIPLLVQAAGTLGPEPVIAGAHALAALVTQPRTWWRRVREIWRHDLRQAQDVLVPDDAALILFTTGTTGEPRPVVLSHRTLVTECELLARAATELGEGSVMLVNQSLGQIGGTTAALLPALWRGCTAALLRVFDARASLAAVAARHVTCLCQTPAQYRLEWDLPDYDGFERGTLALVMVGGAAVDVAFLRQLARMAKRCATGMVMTEAGGFVTLTPPWLSPEEMSGQAGRSYDELAKVSVRRLMRADGSSGEEVADGEVGEVCCHPPLVFAGYFGQPEITRQTLSSDGLLYTGDLGYFKDMKTHRALCLCGRRKFVIRQKGYQVFPEEVSVHLALHAKVAAADVVGVPHALFEEGIIAFVKPHPGVALSVEELVQHCSSMAAYKRPLHIEILRDEEELPVTRTAKIDKLVLQQRALMIVERLRAEGKWDRDRGGAAA